MLKCPDIGSHREAGDGLDLRPPRAPASDRDSERAPLAKTESTAGPRQTSPRAPTPRPRRRGLRIWRRGGARGRAAIKRAPPCACRGDRRPATLARLPSLIFPAKRLFRAGLGLAPRPDTAGGARARWPDGGRGRRLAGAGRPPLSGRGTGWRSLSGAARSPRDARGRPPLNRRRSP